MQSRKISQIKSLGSLYLTMIVIATVILSTNFGLASAQNKTYPGPTSIKGTLANTTKANLQSITCVKMNNPSFSRRKYE